MLMDHHYSQQHAGLHHAVRQPQQEVTRPVDGLLTSGQSYKRSKVVKYDTSVILTD